MKNIELNELTRGIYKVYQKKRKEFCNYHPSTLSECDEVFDKLVLKIHERTQGIPKYVKNPRQKPYKTWVETGDFVLTFSINPDLSSELILEKKSRMTEHLPPSFITTRVKARAGYVYFVKSEFGYKIGRTSDIKSRMNMFGVKLPFDVELYAYFKSMKYEKWELLLHKMFADKRINGEWFDINEEDFKAIEKEVKENNMELIYEQETA